LGEIVVRVDCLRLWALESGRKEETVRITGAENWLEGDWGRTESPASTEAESAARDFCWITENIRCPRWRSVHLPVVAEVWGFDRQIEGAKLREGKLREKAAWLTRRVGTGI
jgi:hypothetical protein